MIWSYEQWYLKRENLVWFIIRINDIRLIWFIWQICHANISLIVISCRINIFKLFQPVWLVFST